MGWMVCFSSCSICLRHYWAGRRRSRSCQGRGAFLHRATPHPSSCCGGSSQLTWHPQSICLTLLLLLLFSLPFCLRAQQRQGVLLGRGIPTLPPPGGSVGCRAATLAGYQQRSLCLGSRVHSAAWWPRGVAARCCRIAMGQRRASSTDTADP